MLAMSLLLRKEKGLSCVHAMSSKRSTKRVVPTRSLVKFTTSYFLVTVVVLLCHQTTTTSARSIEIKKTIKEELLPGSVVAELIKEPELKTLLENAKTDTNGNGSLHFSVLSSGNPSASYFTVEPTKGVISIRNRLDRETVCSFRSECLLEFEVAARSILGSFFRLVQFAVTVLDINDNSPEFTEPRFELYFPEESDAGRRFPLPTAFDKDTGPGNGVSDYELLQGPPMFKLFTEQTVLNTTDVFLVLDSVVNREKSESYKVKFHSMDFFNYRICIAH